MQILSGRRSTRRALPWPEIERAFPGRSRTAVHQRIHKLTRAGRIKRAARHWSTAECRTLMRIWSESTVRTMLQHLPGRSWVAICAQARVLGLEPSTRRLTSVTAAARELGIVPKALLALCARANIPTYTAPHVLPGSRARARARAEARRLAAQEGERPRTSGPRRYVDLDAVIDAFEAEQRLEPLQAAAERHDLHVFTLRRWLTAASVVLVRVGKGMRVDPAEVDRAIALRGWNPDCECIAQAARRLRVSTGWLTRLLRKAGYRGTRGCPVYVRRAEIDRLVATHRAARNTRGAAQ